MMGRASIPRLCQNNEASWNVPKWSSRTKPIIPIHPRSSSCPGEKVRATTQRRVAPRVVSITAQNQSRMRDAGTSLLASRKDSASIPGQASRYATERQAAWGTRVRAFHQLNHFNPAKREKANTHINAQGFSEFEMATAPMVRTVKGIHPIILLIVGAGFTNVVLFIVPQNFEVSEVGLI
jgi:hypothetical protein